MNQRQRNILLDATTRLSDARQALQLLNIHKDDKKYFEKLLREASLLITEVAKGSK